MTEICVYGAGSIGCYVGGRLAATGSRVTFVGRERLGNAVVLQQMSMNGTRVFGPSIAGLLIGIPAFGVGGVYLMTTTLMLTTLWNTSRLPHGRPPEDREVNSPLREMGDGVRYVRDRRPLLILVLGNVRALGFGPLLTATIHRVHADVAVPAGQGHALPRKDVTRPAAASGASSQGEWPASSSDSSDALMPSW